MNKWVEKSIQIAKNNFYLDKLLDIYPPDEIGRNLFIENESSVLKDIFVKKDRKKTLEELIRLKKSGFKFPIENSYISFLCHLPDAVNKNPKLVKFITNEIFKIDYGELEKRLEAPKKSSRRIGPMFQDWLMKNFEFVLSDEFFSIKKEKPYFLNSRDANLRKYAENNLHCRLGKLSKGLDFIGKQKDKYFIGTAKFITDFGGSQDNQFYEAIRFIKETKCPDNVIKFAVIDGVAWLESNSKKGRKMQNILKKLKDNQFCFSALLLEEVLKECV